MAHDLTNLLMDAEHHHCGVLGVRLSGPGLWKSLAGRGFLRCGNQCVPQAEMPCFSGISALSQAVTSKINYGDTTTLGAMQIARSIKQTLF
jgi:hypothetical protein